MARVADHLSVEDLEAGFRSAQDPTATRHVQAPRQPTSPVRPVWRRPRRALPRSLLHHDRSGPDQTVALEVRAKGGDAVEGLR